MSELSDMVVNKILTTSFFIGKFEENERFCTNEFMAVESKRYYQDRQSSKTISGIECKLFEKKLKKNGILLHENSELAICTDHRAILSIVRKFKLEDRHKNIIKFHNNIIAEYEKQIENKTYQVVVISDKLDYNIFW